LNRGASAVVTRKENDMEAGEHAPKKGVERRKQNKKINVGGKTLLDWVRLKPKREIHRKLGKLWGINGNDKGSERNKGGWGEKKW